MVYHGTNAEFNTFDIGMSSGVAGQGVYVTPIRPTDDRYGINTMELFVNMRNPVDFSSGGNLIPLSERFNEAREDFRYSIGAATEAEFKADPNTFDWVVYVEPSYIRTMRSHALKDLKPVTESFDNNSVEKAIMNLFTEFGEVTNTADDYTVVFNRADAGKMMMQSGVDMRTFAPQMKALFETAVHAFDNPQKMMAGHKFHKNVLGFEHFVNKFKDGEGKEFYVRFTVREEKGGRKGVHAATVSDVTVYEMKNAATVSANESEGQYRVFTDKILAKFLSKGNQKLSPADIAYNQDDLNNDYRYSIVSDRKAINAFVAKNPTSGWDCVVIAPKRGEFFIYKTMFGQKRKPYQDKPMVRFSISSRTSDSEPSTSLYGETSRQFAISKNARTISQSGENVKREHHLLRSCRRHGCRLLRHPLLGDERRA